MVKPISEYPEFKKGMKEIEELEQNLKEKEIEVSKINSELKALDFSFETKEDLKKLKDKEDIFRIVNRQKEKAEENLEKAKEILKSIISEVKEDRKKEIYKLALKLNSQITKSIKTLLKAKEEFTILEREIEGDFEELELEGGFSKIIGIDPRYIIKSPLYYNDFFEDSKEFQKKN